VAIPIIVSGADLETALRRRFPNEEVQPEREVHVRTPVGRLKMKAKVLRRSDLQVSVRDNCIIARIPLNLLLIPDTPVGVLGHAQLTAVATLKPQVNPDYSVDPGFKLDYVLDHGAEFKVLGIQINMVEATREALDAFRDEVAVTTRQALAQRLQARQYIQAAWDLLCRPYQVNTNPAVWMWAQPEQLHLLPTSTDGLALKLGIGVQGRFFVNVQPEPPITVTNALPLLRTNVVDEALQLNVPVQVPYASIRDYLDKRLGGTTNLIDGHVIEYSRFDVFGGLDGEMVVGVFGRFTPKGVLPKASGWIFVRGRPGFDAASNKLVFTNLAFDPRTESKLLNRFAWVASPRITGWLRENLKYDLADLTRKVLDGVNSYGKELELADGVSLRAGAESVSVHKVYVGRSHLTLLVQCTGKAGLYLDPSRLFN